MTVSKRTRTLFIAFVIGMTAREASAQITMVYDTFTGANGTPLASHTPDANLPLANWTIRTNGTLVLNGNAALSTQGDGWTWPSWAAIESNTCDGTIAVDWTPGAGMPYGPRSGLIFRMSDANNYWYAGYGMQGTPLGLWKVVNGSPGLVTYASVSNPLGSTHHLEVRLEDSAIEVWWDGTLKIQRTDAFNAWSTMHGVEWTVNEDWASTFDNFTVQTPSYQAVSSVVVTPVGSLTGAGAAQFLTATALNAQGQPIPDALFHWTIDDPTHGELRTVGHYAGSAAIVALTGNLTVTAEMLGGPNGSAAITVDATRTMVFDAFTDATGTQLAAHVPTMNPAQAAWSVNATQPMTVQGNQLTSAQTDCPYQPVATLNGSTSDGIVSADWTPAASGPVGGVIVRATNNYNYWFAGYGFAASKLSLYKAVSGSFVQIATMDPGPVLGRSHHIEVRLSGSNIELWWDGALKLQVTDNYLSTATHHGLTWGGCADSTSTFDNFAVQLPALPAPTHVTVSPATVTVPPGGTQTFTAQALDGANAVIPGTLFHWTVSSNALGQVQSTSYYATSARVSGVTGNLTVNATPVGGAAGSSSVTMDASTTLLFDAFTGSDNVALPVHVPDIDVVGSAWTMHTTAQVELSGNRARSTQQDSPYLPVALIDASTSEGVVSADWTPAAGLPNGPIGGVVGRGSDEYNYWFGGYGYQGTQLALWKMVNGTPGLVVYGSVPNPLGQTHHVELRFNGPVVQLWWDGVLQLQVSDAFNQTGTQYGLVFGAGSDSSSMFDNLSVQGVPSPTVTQVIVTPGNPSVALGGLQILTAQALDAQNHVIPNALFHWTINDPSGAVLVTSHYFSSSAIVRAVAHDVTVTAAMAWGPSASASIVADASHILVYDTFTGPDNTLLTSHPPEVNPGAGTWRSPSGQPVPVLQSGQLILDGSSQTWLMDATIETRATDVRVGADWTAATGMPYGPIGGIIFRQRDDQNYWFAGYGFMTYPLALWRVVNGNWGAVAWAPVARPAGGETHHLEVVTSGVNIEVWWDGLRRIQYSSGFTADGSKVGFKWFPDADWASTFDTLSVVGAVRCVDPLAPSQLVVDAVASSGSIAFTSPVACNWSVASDAPWITTTSPSAGSGNGSVSYSIAPNPNATPRVGSVIVGGRLVTIVQQAAALPPCTFDTWPGGWTAPGSGGTFSVSVHPVGGCAWFTTMDVPGPSWIQASGDSGGTAIDGTVTYTLEPNPSSVQRSAVIHINAGSPAIGSLDYTVTQDVSSGSGTPPGSTPGGSVGQCVESLSENSVLMGSHGGRVLISVGAPSGCTWGTGAIDPWLSLDPASGVGTTGISVDVQTNPSDDVRSTLINLGGQWLRITQSGPSIQITRQLVATAQTYSTDCGPYVKIDENGNVVVVWPCGRRDGGPTEPPPPPPNPCFLIPNLCGGPREPAPPGGGSPPGPHATLNLFPHQAVNPGTTVTCTVTVYDDTPGATATAQLLITTPQLGTIICNKDATPTTMYVSATFGADAYATPGAYSCLGAATSNGQPVSVEPPSDSVTISNSNNPACSCVPPAFNPDAATLARERSGVAVYFNFTPAEWSAYGPAFTDPNGYFWKAAGMWNQGLATVGASETVYADGGGYPVSLHSFASDTPPDSTSVADWSIATGFRFDMDRIRAKGYSAQDIATIVAHEIEHAFGGIHKDKNHPNLQALDPALCPSKTIGMEGIAPGGGVTQLLQSDLCFAGRNYRESSGLPKCQ